LAYALFQLSNGIVFGMLLFLTAAGLSLIFGLMNIVNVSHGSFFALGAFFCLTLHSLTGSFWIAVLLAPFPTMIIGLLMERLFLRHLYSRGHLDQMLLTFGFAYVFYDLIRICWGDQIQNMSPPMSGVIEVGDFVLPSYRVFVAVTGFLIAFLIWFAVERTMIGAKIRAAVDDTSTANAIGINVPFLFSSVFAFGAGLAALGGAIAAPILGVYPGMDFEILIPAFLVVVIGGLGSLRGAFFGSLLLGISDAIGRIYIPEASMFLMYLVMGGVMLFRPEGLFSIGRGSR
jgi:branched-subunit amino acid ABC-type transport system permease component